MSLRSRREYLSRIKPRYLKAIKEEKGIILDEYCLATGLVRKYVIRILSAKVSDKDKVNRVRKKREPVYDTFVIIKLKELWRLMDYPCGLRMKPMISEWLGKLKSFGEITLSEEVENKLLQISASTIDRKLWKARTEEHRKTFSTTKPGTLLKNQIPIRTSSWEETQIGNCELDTVAHCGDSASGLFAFTLNLIDILTGWDESETVLGKGEKGIVSALENIKKRLPFPLIAIDPDNGGEFINHHMVRFCLENKIGFTRGRPYKKNDNAHIEQKNWTHVRKVFGYSRIEDEEIIEKMNELNRKEIRLYKNFFQANVKLVEKKRIGKNKEKIKKIHDEAKTPYQRIIDCDQVEKTIKTKLREVYEKLNPAELKRNIDNKIKIINKLILEQLTRNRQAKEKSLNP
ncbi:MAG: hypothetical protein V1716_02410 [Candidatus Uhrbacteria bacterium]